MVESPGRAFRNPKRYKTRRLLNIFAAEIFDFSVDCDVFLAEFSYKTTVLRRVSPRYLCCLTWRTFTYRILLLCSNRLVLALCGEIHSLISCLLSKTLVLWHDGLLLRGSMYENAPLSSKTGLKFNRLVCFSGVIIVCETVFGNESEGRRLIMVLVSMKNTRGGVTLSPWFAFQMFSTHRRSFPPTLSTPKRLPSQAKKPPCMRCRSRLSRGCGPWAVGEHL